MTLTAKNKSLVEVSVIIPFEFILVTTPPPLPPLDKLLPAEDCIKVCASRNIKVGTLFNTHGLMRTDKLPPFPVMQESVLQKYGAFDVLDYSGRRTCNWVRLLKYLPYHNHEVNLISFCAFNCDTIFLTTREIVQGEQLIAYLIPTDHTNIIKLKNLIQENVKSREKLVDDCNLPLDLSVSSEMGRRRRKRAHSVETDIYSDYSRCNSPEDIDLPKEPLRVPALHPFNIVSPLNNQPNIFEPCSPPISYSGSPPISYSGSPPISYSGSSHSYINELRKKVSLKLVSPKRRTKNVLPCNTCSKVFDRPSLLKRHERTHTGEKPHVCDICGKGFSTSSSLNTHRRIHSGEKPHKCKICGKTFTASSNLYYHKMTHVKDKPHKCPSCTRSFPTPGDLKCHMYTHNGNWPYTCQVCDKGFSKLTNFRNHKILHDAKANHILRRQTQVIAV